jgi:hypothetical protein
MHLSAGWYFHSRLQGYGENTRKIAYRQILADSNISPWRYAILQVANFIPEIANLKIVPKKSDTGLLDLENF